MQEALSRYRKALELDPGYLPAQYRLALVHLDLNQPDDALKIFISLMDKPDFSAAANNGLGQVFMMKQEHQKAVEHFTRALELQPQATKIHYPLAVSLRAAGQTQKAKEHLKMLGKQEIVVNDKLVDALQALRNPASRHFGAAMTAVISKDYTTAVSEFSKGLEYEPENVSARTSFARVLYLNGNKPEARKQLEIAISKNPDKTLALFLLATLDDESKDIEQAAVHYRRVIELNPEHEGANFFLGNYYLHRENYKKAIEHYESAISSNEKNIPAMMFKLVAMMGSDSPDKALLGTVIDITDRAPGMVSAKRVQILLLALSRDNKVRDAGAAIKLAEQMYQQHQFPVNLELLALATAAGGDFETAVKKLRHALASEQQYKGSPNLARMENILSSLEKGDLPELGWHNELMHMQPPPTNALATFRDYPDPNPI